MLCAGKLMESKLMSVRATATSAAAAAAAVVVAAAAAAGAAGAATCQGQAGLL